MKRQRRRQLVEAFERVLAAHGYQGATINRLAAEAGVSPGIVHHYFVDKDDLSLTLFAHLRDKLRLRIAEATTLEQTLEMLLRLDADADPVSARAWVGLWGEALRKPTLMRSLRGSVRGLHRRFVSTGASEDMALGLVALVVGFLVIGALDPKLSAGRAASIALKVADLRG